ncbi:hypothetical protein PIB30_104748, partial [Stylosanthes scabra]|nr:hypothetical protein [Stylosanthes scabra]
VPGTVIRRRRWHGHRRRRWVRPPGRHGGGVGAPISPPRAPATVGACGVRITAWERRPGRRQRRGGWRRRRGAMVRLSPLSSHSSSTTLVWEGSSSFEF